MIFFDKRKLAPKFFNLRRKYKDSSHIAESFFRLGERYFHMNFFRKGDTESIFNYIYASGFWKRDESNSGIGSSMESTNEIRKTLPVIIEEYSIESILDAPCGDYHWMKTVDKKCNYIGGDIVHDLITINNEKYSSDKVHFMHIDIITSELPKVDLIICRDCLQHLSYENIFKALNNFKQSGSKYLLVTSYPSTLKNWNIYDGNYFPLNLRKFPFNLPRPLRMIREIAPKNEIDKTMCVYNLDDINVDTTKYNSTF